MKKMKNCISRYECGNGLFLTGCSSGGKESAAPESKPAKLRHPPQANLQMVRRQRRTAVIPLK